MLPNPQEPALRTDLVCYHCGESCRETTLFIEEKAFCCDGCRLVYEILNENNLCSYYALNPSSGNSPDKAHYKGKFAYANQEDVRAKLLHFTNGQQAHVTFFVPGIHCSSCIWLLENLQRIEPGVLSSSVNFPKREVTVIFNESETRLSSIAERMTMIGYEPHISLSDIEDSKTSTVDRSQWYKIGIAGFCFGNIMMMSFPEYFSIGEIAGQADLQRTFTWLNFGLSLPVLLYSSRDFFISALGAIRSRHLNIDLPIAAAILMTFLRSVYEVFSATGPGYFDSMSGIVFFMLIGRSFQNRTYETLSFDRDYKSYFPVAVTVISELGEEQIPVTNLRKGMRMLIRNQEIVPADAILLRGDAQIDYSFVTGESDPVSRQKGELVYAGGRQAGSSIEMEIVKPVKQSYLTQLWNSPAFRKDTSELEQASMENKINQYFTLGVFLVALASAGFWLWAGDTHRMMNAVTTILIVACPCILLLASTFTNGNVLRILGSNGFYLKNAFVIEKMAKADTIVFDKTGTITLSRDTQVHFDGRMLTEDEITAVYSVALQSTHPLSASIAASYQGKERKSVSEYFEFPGQGIQGNVDGKFIQLGSADFISQTYSPEGLNKTRIYVKIDGEQCGYYSLQHQLRDELPALLSHLRGKYNLFLLSGDTDADRQQLSAWFEPDHMLFQQKPEDKLNFIRQLQHNGHKVLMLGDGLNDAGALQQSDAGIAVSDNLNNFSPACDAILDGKLLPRLNTLLDYCRSGKRVIAVSFAISLLYNAVGLWFAVRGELQPVIAAILMPITSISIVSFATLTSTLIARRKGL